MSSYAMNVSSEYNCIIVSMVESGEQKPLRCLSYLYGEPLALSESLRELYPNSLQRYLLQTAELEYPSGQKSKDNTLSSCQGEYFEEGTRSPGPQHWSFGASLRNEEE